MKAVMQTWLRRFRTFLVFVYGPSRTARPHTKRPPTGPVYDLVVVTLFFVLGVGLLVV